MRGVVLDVDRQYFGNKVDKYKNACIHMHKLFFSLTCMEEEMCPGEIQPVSFTESSGVCIPRFRSAA